MLTKNTKFLNQTWILMPNFRRYIQNPDGSCKNIINANSHATKKSIPICKYTSFFNHRNPRFFLPWDPYVELFWFNRTKQVFKKHSYCTNRLCFLICNRNLSYNFESHGICFSWSPWEHLQYLRVWGQGWKCREKITKKQMIVTIIRIDKRTILK